jgi:septum formation inhibitor-activating ATPase MinD
VKQSLLVTRYDPVRASKDECLRLEDIKELLGLQVTAMFIVYIAESQARGMRCIG